MLRLLFINFIRSKATTVGLSFLLLAGCTSLFIGKQFLQRQKEAVQETASFQKEFISNYVSYIPDDIGLLLYYLRFALVNETPAMAGISIGQRDINPSIQSVTIRNLENQKWDTDLNNPVNLLLGNMDLGFVVIYLFPLLMIAFTYNILSEEKEGGTWKMVSFQAPSALKLIRQKFMVRVLVLYTAALLLLALAKLLLGIPFNVQYLALIALVSFYLIFWCSLCYWIVSGQKSSAFNAVILIALWVGLTILTPAIINTYVSYKYPVPEALQTVVKQRQGYHEKWDMDKHITMGKFYRHYPHLKKYPLPDTEFSWIWYYAMHQMGDDESARESAALRAKLQQRENLSSKMALILPVLHTQLLLNKLVGSDLENHLLFLKQTEAFHEKKRLFFYDQIFGNRPVKSMDWNKIEVERFTATSPVNWMYMLLPLGLIAVAFFVAAEYRFRKREGD